MCHRDSSYHTAIFTVSFSYITADILHCSDTVTEVLPVLQYSTVELQQDDAQLSVDLGRVSVSTNACCSVKVLSFIYSRKFLLYAAVVRSVGICTGSSASGWQFSLLNDNLWLLSFSTGERTAPH